MGQCGVCIFHVPPPHVKLYSKVSKHLDGALLYQTIQLKLEDNRSKSRNENIFSKASLNVKHLCVCPACKEFIFHLSLCHRELKFHHGNQLRGKKLSISNLKDDASSIKLEQTCREVTAYEGSLTLCYLLKLGISGVFLWAGFRFC